MKFYRGPFVKAASPIAGMPLNRRPPAGTAWTLDFSTLGESGSKTDQAGQALFAVSDATTLGAPYTLLFQGDFNSTLSAGERTALLALMRVTPLTNPPTLGATLLSGLMAGTVAGDTAVRCCQPTRSGWVLAGPDKIMALAPLDLADATAAPYIALMQAEYRRLKTEAEAGKILGPNRQPDLLFANRWLTTLDEKFGRDDAEKLFVPADLPKPTKLPHNTAYSDAFPSNSVITSGQTLTWVEIGSGAHTCSGGVVQNTALNTDAFSRAQHDTSSSDQYVHATIEDINNFSVLAICARYTAAAVSCYKIHAVCFGAPSAGTQFEVVKNVTGTDTTLDTLSNDPTAGDVYRLEVSGSGLTAYQNGVSMSALTDTALPTGTRGGIGSYCEAPTTTGGCRQKLFSFGDLAAAAGTSKILLLGVG